MLSPMDPGVRDLRKHLVRIEVVVQVVEVVCDEAHLDGDVQLDLVDDPALATCSACLAALDVQVGRVVPLVRRTSATSTAAGVGIPRKRSA